MICKYLLFHISHHADAHTNRNCRPLPLARFPVIRFGGKTGTKVQQTRSQILYMFERYQEITLDHDVFIRRSVESHP